MPKSWLDANTKAVLLGSLSGCFVAVTNLCVKLSSAEMTTFQVLLIISAGNLLISSTLALIFKKGLAFKKENGFNLMMRSLVMTAARVFYYIAIARLPVFDAETVKNTRAVFTLLLLTITCQESFGIVEILGSLFTFIGVVFVCQPPMIFGGSSQSVDILGVIFGLLSATCHASGYLFTKKILEVHYTTMNFYEFLFHGIASIFMIIVYKEYVFPTTYRPYLIVGIATMSLFTTTALQIVALSFGSAAIVAITINMNVPALFLLQAIFQRIVPNYLTVLGSILVLGGVFIVSFRKYLNDKWDAFKVRCSSPPSNTARLLLDEEKSELNCDP